MNDSNDDVIQAANSIRKKPGRPLNSLNKNTPYKQKEREKAVALKKLWETGTLYWKLDANQKTFRDIYYNHGDWTTLPCLWGRQLGKCVISTTYVATPFGPTMIKDIKVGDYVIGYNADGTTSPTEVKQVHKQGIKKVVELLSKENDELLISCTLDHRSLFYCDGEVVITLKEAIEKNSLLVDLHGNYIDFYIGDEYEAETYDLGIDNGTHLYCLANGMVTHNSYAVCTIILEEAISKPGIQMAYIAPKLNQAKKIVNSKFRELLSDCPEELRPKFNSIENKWTWPNGSELYLAGTDNNNAENIRGSTFNRVFVDEFCFLDDFEYVMNSIIFPTMMSVEDPLMVLISSPPKTMDHESNKWLDEAEASGRLTVRTIYDCPRHTKNKIARIIREQYHNDPLSDDFRRECLCHRIADSSKLVIPEATTDRVNSCVRVIPRPDFFTINEAFDWGAADKNAGLFSYANYDDKLIVIENEMWLSDNQYTTADIAREIRSIEAALWEDNLPKNRYGDNNNGQLLIDMSVMYDLHIYATRKDGLIASINHVRQLLKNGQIVINPRCVNLIKQLQSCTWLSSEKKKFAHKTEKDENGQEYKHHYDLIAALIYLVRNSNMEVSPYPINYDLLKRGYHPDTHFLSPKRENKQENNLTKFLREKFTIRRK